MLTVHQSNRVEILAGRLVEVLRPTVGHPFVPDWVVVPNSGMKRWVSMRVADRLGLCANLRFRMPEELVWDVFRAGLSSVPGEQILEPTVFTWMVSDELERVGNDARFAPVLAYLAGGADVDRFELARRVADALLQVLIFRPDWIRTWEAGDLVPVRDAPEDETWQAELWRRLRARGIERHRAVLLEELRGATAFRNLPSRISLFGIPALPPSTLEVFCHLSRAVDVHLFLLDPCRAYWSEIRSRRASSRLARDRDPADLHLEQGNALLASLGSQGRELIALIQDLSDEDVRCEDEFLEPGEDSLLHILQSDILELRDRGAAPPGAEPDPLRPPVARIPIADRSVQVHACHGPMREVEILHDHLLDLFARHPDLQPSDVLVMTPDIEALAPFVEAVFDTAPEDRRIPFTIADRSLRSESSLVAAFFGLLELPRSRWDAVRLIDLLVTPPVLRRFALEAEDAELVQHWVRETAIRWGIDESTRSGLGLPASREHTWRFGLDRLAVGYALAADDDDDGDGDGGRKLFSGILPFADVEGGSALVLGKAHAFAEAAFALRDALAAERTPGEWAATLATLLDGFFLPDDAETADLDAIRMAIDELERTAGAAACATPVSLDLVRHFLAQRLAAPAGGGSFLAGRVTFCAMVPMRSIPFEVVCLVGMNDGVFPRSHRPVGFDLIAREPRRRLGDRSRRDDDRYLFLEAMLSARRCLYVSYVGHDIRDDSERPPSVVVSELLDAIGRGFALDDPARSVVDHVRAHHPLQGFSPRYFAPEGSRDPRLFSFSRELCAASLVVARGGGRSPEPLVVSPLPAPDDDGSRIELDDLLRFFANPARQLLENRLGIRLKDAEAMIETREPFAVEGLERWSLDQQILELHLAGRSREEMLAILRADGRLPHGRLAEVVLADESAGVERFVERLERLRGDGKGPAFPFEIETAGVALSGVLGPLTSKGQFAYRFAKTRGIDLLTLWIRHLVLCAVAPQGIPLESRWMGTEKGTVRFKPVEDPGSSLSELIGRYRQGQLAPLAFFPKSAWAYASTRAKSNSSDEAALASAASEWRDSPRRGGPPKPGEGRDPYFSEAFRGVDPLGEEFRETALAVFDALLQHREDLKDGDE